MYGAGVYFMCVIYQKLFYSTGVGSDLSFQTGSPYTIYFCKPDELAQKSIHSISPDSEVSNYYECCSI